MIRLSAAVGRWPLRLFLSDEVVKLSGGALPLFLDVLGIVFSVLERHGRTCTAVCILGGYRITIYACGAW